MHLLDLTRVLDGAYEPYREGEYADPSLECIEWSTIAEQGFRVSELRLGTQTGTHIDAPAHFLEGGDTLDALDIAALVGPYHLIDLDSVIMGSSIPQASAEQHSSSILFLHAQTSSIQITDSVFDRLLKMEAPVWVISTDIVIENAPIHTFHTRLAEAGKYLVEDLDTDACRALEPGGEIFIMPLRLAGVCGSPCRVVVRYAD